jgi:RNA polymerase sigma factor (sigma-70 family)
MKALLEIEDRLGGSGYSDGIPFAKVLDSRTQRTLLDRLGKSGGQNQDAWSEFVDRYGGKIYGWCLRWGLQQADAQDVTQVVLLRLVRRMKEFTYDPGRSFRAWLKTVTHHAWRDFLASRQHTEMARGADGDAERLDSLTARDDLSRRVEDLFDLELLDAAMKRVRLRAAPHTWQAFSLTAVEGVAAPEVARRLGMKVSRVWAARSIIQQRLQEECRKLEELP